MAYTAPSDLFIPEIVGALADERLFKKNTLLKSGYIGDARNSAIVDGTGETIKFPKFVEVGGNLGVQTNAQTGTAVTADKFDMSFDPETVAHKIVAYDMEEYVVASLAKLADANSYMADEVVKRVDNHVQDALISCAETAATALSMVYTAGGTGTETTWSWNSMVEAGVNLWGEYAFGGPSLLVCHPNVAYDIFTSNEAKQVGTFGGPGSVQTGQVYFLAGKAILPLASITSTAGVYNNLVLQPGTLQFYPMTGIGYHEQRKAHTTLWQLDWDFAYATHFSRNKPYGGFIYKCISSLD